MEEHDFPKRYLFYLAYSEFNPVCPHCGKEQVMFCNAQFGNINTLVTPDDLGFGLMDLGEAGDPMFECQACRKEIDPVYVYNQQWPVCGGCDRPMDAMYSETIEDLIVGWRCDICGFEQLVPDAADLIKMEGEDDADD